MKAKRWSIWYVGIIVCAIIMGIDGIRGLIYLLGNAWLWEVATFLAVPMLIVGVLEIASAIGIVKLLEWAYYLTIGINIAGIILTIILAASFSRVLETLGFFSVSLSRIILPDIILPLLIIGYFLIPRVRAVFEPFPE